MFARARVHTDLYLQPFDLALAFADPSIHGLPRRPCSIYNVQLSVALSWTGSILLCCWFLCSLRKNFNEPL